MKCDVVGKRRGVSKKSGSNYNQLHIVRDCNFNDFSGRMVEVLFCTDSVYEQIIVGMTYDLGAEFGSKNVSSAVLC